ncbi:MAG: phosphatidate cytidylyltransferase [Planctomycetes bacterium]|nr:phosphatidate cytidylyltransferase [Planctomycetota bacterium]
MQTELKYRLIYGHLVAAIAITSIMMDMAYGMSYCVIALICIGFLCAAHEMSTLAKHYGAAFSRTALIVCGLCTMAWLVISSSLEPCPLHQQLSPYPMYLLILICGFMWLCIAHIIRNGHEGFLKSVGMGSMSLIYLGLTCTSMLAIAAIDDNPTTLLAEGQWAHTRGHQLLLLLCAACKLGDVAALFGGKAFGKHKLAPRGSPGKTWEGFYFSIFGSIGGTYLFYAIFYAMDLPLAFDGWWQPCVWGLILGPIGVLGDLTESCMKRELGVKDSGNTIPGLGGFLDVFDAIIFAAPIGYILAIVLV